MIGLEKGEAACQEGICMKDWGDFWEGTHPWGESGYRLQSTHQLFPPSPTDTICIFANSGEAGKSRGNYVVQISMELCALVYVWEVADMTCRHHGISRVRWPCLRAVVVVTKS